ncbi:MAG: hypothetical protein PHV76_08245 [Bacteroidales bacterium]|nr:hypothetical protein [Bacteroidales bacterium]MDD3397923.1 hypothetical protein [Clostridia bacterium]
MLQTLLVFFERLHQKAKFDKVMAEHHNKNKYNFPVQDNNNIDIMMETGTGKTYLDTGSVGKFQKDISGDFELEIVEQDPDIESIDKIIN